MPDPAHCCESFPCWICHGGCGSGACLDKEERELAPLSIKEASSDPEPSESSHLTTKRTKIDEGPGTLASEPEKSRKHLRQGVGAAPAQFQIPDHVAVIYREKMKHWRKCKLPYCPLKPLRHTQRGETSAVPPAWKGLYYNVNMCLYIAEVSPPQWHGEETIELGSYKLHTEAAMAFDVAAYYVGRNVVYNFGSPHTAVHPFPPHLRWDEPQDRMHIKIFIQREASVVAHKHSNLMVSEDRFHSGCWLSESTGARFRAVDAVRRMMCLISQEAILQLNPLQCKVLASKLEYIQEVIMSSKHTAAHNLGLVYPTLLGILEKTERLVQECCSQQWLPVALAQALSKQELVELLLEMHWWADMLQIATAESTGAIESHNPVLKMRNAEESYEQQLEYLQVHNSLTTQILQDREILLVKLKAMFIKEYPPESPLANLRGIASFLSKRLQTSNENLNSSAGAFWKPPELEGGIMIDLKHDRLGRGAAGVVSRITWLGKKYALKMATGVAEPEATVLAKHAHPHIWEEEANNFLLMELMEGDLSKLMEQRMSTQLTPSPPFLLPEAIDIIMQVAKAMRYLHSVGVIHRDLKCLNILWKYDNQDRKILVKLADFGTAKTNLGNSETDTPHSKRVGTPGWCPPELLRILPGTQAASEENKLSYPFAADVFSFGMTCFEILTGTVPLKDVPRGEMYQRLISGFRPNLQEAKVCPPFLQFIIESCWATEPRARPTFKQIFRMLSHAKNIVLGMTFYVDITPFFSYTSYEGVKQISKQESWTIRTRRMVRKLSSTVRATTVRVAHQCFDTVWVFLQWIVFFILAGKLLLRLLILRGE